VWMLRLGVAGDRRAKQEHQSEGERGMFHGISASLQ
jgi:hypothetical protein